jgi:integrase
MATIGNDPNGLKRILFVAPDGKRKTIRLGKATMKQATAFKVKVEALIGQTITGVVDDEVSRWLAGLDAEMYGRLAAVGLAPKRASARLGEFLAGYIAQRTDIKPRTRINLEQARSRLVEFFGADRNLRDITPADADAWAIWLKEQEYADGTAARTIKRARQFFKAAVRGRVLRENPFGDVKGPKATNESRKFFVTRDMAARVLDACPDLEWRLIFALARYGGLRVPSELFGLKWADVDWERGRFMVHSPKKEHLEGGADRWVPIFPELRPLLDEAWERAEPGAVYVIGRYRDTNKNLRTRMHRIIRRAGLSPWPKTFVNLRASRETELAGEYPMHVVCAWIGNTEMIAAKHYLQVTEAHYEQAAQKAAQSAAERGWQRETAVPAESPNVRAVNDLHLTSTPVKTCDYPQGE